MSSSTSSAPASMLLTTLTETSPAPRPTVTPIRSSSNLTYTKSDLITFNYRWVLDNVFDYIPLRSTANRATRIAGGFTSPADPGLTFRVEAFLGQTEQKVALLLDVVTLEGEVRNVTLIWKVSILQRGGPLKVGSRECTIIICDSIKSWSPYVNFGDLPQSLADLTTASGQLVFLFEINYVLNSTDSSRLATSTATKLTNLTLEAQQETLSAMGRLLVGANERDLTYTVTLVVGTREFKAHRAILSIRSSTMERLLSGGHRRVIITAIEGRPEIFSKILHFIYTGTVEGAEPVARELLGAAEKFALPLLKSICEQHLIASLSQATVLEMAVLSVKLKAPELEAHAMAFIGCHAPTLMESAAWTDLLREHPSLFNRFCRQVILQQAQGVEPKNTANHSEV